MCWIEAIYTLNYLIDPIRKHLEKLDLAREEVLRRSRRFIRASGGAIKALHRNQIQPALEKIESAQENIKLIRTLTQKHPELQFQGYVTTAEQELGEALLFLAFVRNEKLPSAAELTIRPYPYLMALADFIGELRRYILDKLRQNDFEQIEPTLDLMDELMSTLFSLDFVDGLVPGFRRKVDLGRGLVERTRGDVTTALPRERLRQELQNLSEQLKK